MLTTVTSLFSHSLILAAVLMAGSILGFSVPTFWAGLMLIMVFSVQLGWLPTSGRGDTVNVLGIEWSFLTVDGLRHLLMPSLNLALFQICLLYTSDAADE